MWCYLILTLWLLLWPLICALWAISKLISFVFCPFKTTFRFFSTEPLRGPQGPFWIPCWQHSWYLSFSQTLLNYCILSVVCVHAWGWWVPHSVWRSENHLQRQALTFYRVGPRDQAQAVRLGDKSAPLPAELLSGPSSLSTCQSSLADLGRANSQWDQQPKNFQLSQLTRTFL